MSKPSIAVVIPVYNGAKFIVSCLESVLTQEHQPDEIIVVNDGSTDNTEALVRNNFDGRVTLFSQENKGRSVARNVGMELASSDYVAFLDADDTFFTHHLKSLYESAVSSPAEIIYNAKSIGADPSGEAPAFPEGRDAFKHLRRVRIPVQCSMIKRLWVKERQIEFDKDLHVSEDSLFFKEMILLGARVSYVPLFGTAYNLHEEQTTRDLLKSMIETNKANQKLYEFIDERGVALAGPVKRAVASVLNNTDVYILLGKTFYGDMSKWKALTGLLWKGCMWKPLAPVSRTRCFLALLWLFCPMLRFKTFNKICFGEYAVHDSRYE